MSQGDARTYSFAAAISSNDDKPNWNELFTLARMITESLPSYQSCCLHSCNY